MKALQVGKNYFIRTVTHYHIGCVKEVTDQHVILSDASWVADTGRFGQFLATGKVSEVEPFVDDVIVSSSSIVDATIWRHPLPREAK